MSVTIDQFEDGPILCAWFEGIPSFHDATLKEVGLRQGAPSHLVIQTFRLNFEVGGDGFLILTNHVTAMLTIFDVIEVRLSHFEKAGTLYAFDIEDGDDGTTSNFEASYGVHGRIEAKRITVAFEPSNPT